jgi:hypothetical protein
MDRPRRQKDVVDGPSTTNDPEVGPPGEAGVWNESSALDNEAMMENTVLRQEHRSLIKESS